MFQLQLFIVRWQTLAQAMKTANDKSDDDSLVAYNPTTLLGYELRVQMVFPNDRVASPMDLDSCSVADTNPYRWRTYFKGTDIFDAQLPPDHFVALARYAIQIRSVVVADGENEKVQAISDIVYFRAANRNSSPPIFRETKAGISWISVDWAPPSDPNGTIAYYLITVKPREDGVSPGGVDPVSVCSVESAQSTLDKAAPNMYYSKMRNAIALNGLNRSATWRDKLKTFPKLIPPSGAKVVLTDDMARERVEDTQFNTYSTNYWFSVRSGSGDSNTSRTESGPSPVNRRSKTKKPDTTTPANMSGVDDEEEVAEIYRFSRRAVTSFDESHYNYERRQPRSTMQQTPPEFDELAAEMAVERTPGFFGIKFDENDYDKARWNYTEMRLLNESERVLNVSNSVFHVNVTDLPHFSEFVVSVLACQKLVSYSGFPLRGLEPFCSFVPLEVVTQNMDAIDERTVTFDQSPDADDQWILKWTVPPTPNGEVIGFNVELKSQASSNTKLKSEHCIRVNGTTNTLSYIVKDMSPGQYRIRVQTLSTAIEGRFIEGFDFEVGGSEISTSLIIGVAVAGLTICCVFFVIGVWYVRYWNKKREDLIVSSNPFYYTPYQADEWELERDELVMRKTDLLGAGSFGKVFMASCRPIRSHCGDTFVLCAVKMQNSGNPFDHATFLAEAQILKEFNGPFICKLYGVVSKGVPVLIVMEYMEKGNLRDYLRARRPGTEEYQKLKKKLPPPELNELVQMSAEIADGMAYLDYKNFVHGDLAARNCLVSHDCTVKIGDFGLARDMKDRDYYTLKGKRMMPVRWMAPETFQESKMSSKSDVWSFGVLLWEVATLGWQPYFDHAEHPEVIGFVTAGNTLDTPTNCPPFVAELMHLCWKFSPADRPTFLEILRFLSPAVNERFCEVSFYHNRERYEASTERPDVVPDSRARLGTSTEQLHLELEEQKKLSMEQESKVRESDLDSTSSHEIEGASADTPLNPRHRRGSRTSPNESSSSPSGTGHVDNQTPVCNNNRRPKSTGFLPMSISIPSIGGSISSQLNSGAGKSSTNLKDTSSSRMGASNSSPTKTRTGVSESKNSLEMRELPI